MKMMARMWIDTNIVYTVQEAENHFPDKPDEDFASSIKAGKLTAMTAEAQLAVGTPGMELLWTTVEESLRNTVLDGCEAADWEIQNSTFQFIVYVLTHLAVVGTPDSILALNVDEWLTSDAIIDAIAHFILVFGTD